MLAISNVLSKESPSLVGEISSLLLALAMKEERAPEPLEVFTQARSVKGANGLVIHAGEFCQRGPGYLEKKCRELVRNPEPLAHQPVLLYAPGGSFNPQAPLEVFGVRARWQRATWDSVRYGGSPLRNLWRLELPEKRGELNQGCAAYPAISAYSGWSPKTWVKRADYDNHFAPGRSHAPKKEKIGEVYVTTNGQYTGAPVFWKHVYEFMPEKVVAGGHRWHKQRGRKKGWVKGPLCFHPTKYVLGHNPVRWEDVPTMTLRDALKCVGEVQAYCAGWDFSLISPKTLQWLVRDGKYVKKYKDGNVTFLVDECLRSCTDFWPLTRGFNRLRRMAEHYLDRADDESWKHREFVNRASVTEAIIITTWAREEAWNQPEDCDWAGFAPTWYWGTDYKQKLGDEQSERAVHCGLSYKPGPWNNMGFPTWLDCPPPPWSLRRYKSTEDDDPTPPGWGLGLEEKASDGRMRQFVEWSPLMREEEARDWVAPEPCETSLEATRRAWQIAGRLEALLDHCERLVDRRPLPSLTGRSMAEVRWAWEVEEAQQQAELLLWDYQTNVLTCPMSDFRGEGRVELRREVLGRNEHGSPVFGRYVRFQRTREGEHVLLHKVGVEGLFDKVMDVLFPEEQEEIVGNGA